MTPHPRNEPIFLWFDLETTGLDVVNGRDEILELGYGFTALDLNWLQAPKSILTEPILKASEDKLYEMADPIVREMHDKSGLWSARKLWMSQQRKLTNVEINIMDNIHAFVDPDTPVTVAGAGVATFDIPIIKLFMPILAARINYFPMDVSNIERFLQLVATGGFRSTSKTADHRAVADIEFAHKQLIHMYSLISRDGPARWKVHFPRWFD